MQHREEKQQENLHSFLKTPNVAFRRKVKSSYINRTSLICQDINKTKENTKQSNSVMFLLHKNSYHHFFSVLPLQHLFISTIHSLWPNQIVYNKIWWEKRARVEIQFAVCKQYRMNLLYAYFYSRLLRVLAKAVCQMLSIYRISTEQSFAEGSNPNPGEVFYLDPVSQGRFYNGNQSHSNIMEIIKFLKTLLSDFSLL